MRRVLLVTLWVLAILPMSGSASAAPLPVVTVTSGPTTPTNVFRECDNAVQTVDAADAFLVHRDLPDASPLAVTYTTSGPARSGSDYEPLPGTVTIPANSDSATVPVTALLGDRTTSVDLTVTISGAAGYTLGDPAAVTLALVVHRNPALGAVDCNPGFQLGPDASNREQTIHVGETPVALTTTGGAGYMRLIDGALPPGISILGDVGTPGAFLGTATTTGDYRATLEACPVSSLVFTCRRTTLVIHVLAATQPAVTSSTSAPAVTNVAPSSELPVTGSSVLAITIVGLSSFLIGAVIARASRRRVT